MKKNGHYLNKLGGFEQMEDLQKQIDELTASALEFKAKENENKYNAIMDKVEQLKRYQAERKQQVEQQAEREQERVQKQEEKVASITLPYDFNEVFADPRANDIIIELIQEFQREAYAEHNEEVTKLHIEYKDKQRVADEREIEYKYQNEQLQGIIANGKAENATLVHDNGNLRDRIAELTTELAVRNEYAEISNANITKLEKELEQAQTEIKGLNEHIDTLRIEAAVGAKQAVKVHEVGTSDKLSTLVQQSMADKAKSAYERFLERNKDIAQELDLQPIQLPEVAPVAESFRLEDTEAQSGNGGIPVAAAVEQFREEAGHVVAEGSEVADEQSSVQLQTEVTREEFEALKVAVWNIEVWKGYVNEKIGTPKDGVD